MAEEKQSIPYRCDWDSILRLVDCLKAKHSGADRKFVEGRFGVGEKLAESMNACVQLGLIVEDSESRLLKLTDLGTKCAYSTNDSERTDILLSTLNSYEPYAIVFERAIREGMETIETSWIEKIWQADMKLNLGEARAREGAGVLCKFAERAGLGQHIVGRGGQKTRLALAPGATQKLHSHSASTKATSEENDLDDAPEAAPMPTLASAPHEHQPKTQRDTPRIQITVDVTNWDLSKTREFLKMIGYDEGDT